MTVPTIACRSRLMPWQLLLLLALAAFSANAEDGYELWLRYRPLPENIAQQYRTAIGEVQVTGDSATLQVVRDELNSAIPKLLGPARSNAPATSRVLIAGTPQSNPAIAALNLELRSLTHDGYVIRTIRAGGRDAIVVAAAEDVGVLYGTFHFLRLLQTQQPIDSLNIREQSRVQLRMLNHWDNLDRFVERGYAGESLWDWHKLPDYLDPRYVDYARANASLGINGTVLTNVNASAVALTRPYLDKAAALARVFRPYGIRVFLTARFSAPIELGGLKTADPLDPAVRAWWQSKAKEIYEVIPDFGGFLVKANSEGQPGSTLR